MPHWASMPTKSELKTTMKETSHLCSRFCGWNSQIKGPSKEGFAFRDLRKLYRDYWVLFQVEIVKETFLKAVVELVGGVLFDWGQLCCRRMQKDLALGCMKLRPFRTVPRHSSAFYLPFSKQILATGMMNGITGLRIFQLQLSKS